MRTSGPELVGDAEAEAHEGRQQLLDHVQDLVEWAEEVGGCPEYRHSLATLLRAREAHDEATLAAFLVAGTWPRENFQSQQSSSIQRPAPRVSDVQWTLREDRATYEALLRLIFEDPVPMTRDDLKRWKGAAWRR
jgi:hypothetical protein